MAPRLDNQFMTRVQGIATSADVDAGLRSYMLRVYNYMVLGLALTGAIAFFISTSPSIWQLFFTPTGLSGLGWIAMLSPLAPVLFFMFGYERMSPGMAQAMFWLYAGLNGIGFALIFMVFLPADIFRAFFITAGMFAGMSLIGYTTKRDLTGLGGFLMMGVIGLIIASVVNIFLGSTGLMFIISIASVLIFAGLTAYDTQKIKENYYQVGHDGTLAQKSAIFGALMLYIDFIVMFRNILYLMSIARE
ncbi:MAG: Bax inhibitor-1/YccA family protein [Alphaproteobacteria bacterium]